ncbi:MAG: 16S rRNA (guanine(966)-N(2))-methyltransferase RsmD [Balneolaceae bacterium]|nr:16S rRNA (guanine(966)-N(2))-methyltransferase RsmD [Balneolaceae bacterium]MCH8549501.1 16S rRNA (guanine(966)-N(2))-methyltransferase RsmD [Balneolaceae bacterium]
MRIITGKLKGRTIPVPKTGELRPTSDRAKEGIFSVIDSRTYLESTRVLDLFAGSGNLGFEAISRGASSCLFVDREKAHIDQILKTAGELDVTTQVQTLITEISELLTENKQGSFDFIFADPPYDYFAMEEMISQILEGGWLNEEGWFILEHDKRHDFSGHPNCLTSKSYGRTIAAFFTPDQQ